MRLTVFSIALICAVLPALHANDLPGEDNRWARRALLNKEVRAHLQLEIGQADPLNTILFTPGDFDGPGHAVLLRRDETTVVTVQRGLECLAHCRFKATGELALSTRILAGQPWIFVDETCVEDGATSTLRRLIGLRGNELVVRQSWLKSASRIADDRFERRTESELRAEDDAMLLTTRVTDCLDDKAMDDAQSEQVLRLSPQPDGSLRTEVLRDKPVTLAVKLRHVRVLERERLEAAALMLAREAAEQAERLPGKDARRLDATALVARLEARAKGEAPVHISPDRR